MADVKKISDSFILLLDNITSRNSTECNSLRRDHKKCNRKEIKNYKDNIERKNSVESKRNSWRRKRNNAKNILEGGKKTESNINSDNKQLYDNKLGYKRNAQFDSDRPSKKFCKNTDIVTDSEWLKSLLNSEISIVLTTLACHTSRFHTILNEQAIKSECLILMIQLLKKVSESESDQLKINILSECFKPKFIDEIKHYAVFMSVQDSQEPAKVESFFKDVLSLFETVTSLFPSMMNERLNSTLIALNMALKNLNDQLESNIEKYLYEQLKNLSDRISSYQDIKKTLDATKQLTFEKNTLAPNNFRELELFPMVEDFTCDKPFLRKNVIKGAYRDVEHYLDVQFRLLREDFIAPLRTGIFKYIQSLCVPHAKQKNSYVRIYPKVQFINTFKSRDKFGYLVYFDCDKKLPRNINWEYNKRFMFGSLLLFSSDNFKTFYVATVIEREKNKLEKQLICVSFVPGTDVPENIFDPETFYTMAESQVYYEAYHPVLSALKKMNENNFPMRQYILNVNTVCFPPEHIAKNSVYKISGFKFDLLVNDSWPSNEELKLNPSQHQAIKNALTNDFAVIQGPPGTGKTFLALKITKTLLENRVFATSPIVVICYTNHALDQFLEGVLQYTHNVVRIGSQSKNEALQEYNIDKIRKRKPFLKCSDISQLFHLSIKEKHDLQEKLKGIQKKIEKLSAPKGILNLSVIKPCIAHQHYRELKHKEVDWLYGKDLGGLYAREETQLAQISYENQKPSMPYMTKTVNESKEEIGDDMEDDENAQRLADTIEEDFYEDNFIMEETSFSNYIDYSLDIEIIKCKIKECERDLRFNSFSKNDPERIYFERKIVEQCRELNLLLNFVFKQFFIFKNSKFDPEKFKMLQNIKSAWELTLHDRWEYYFSWVYLYCCHLKKTMHLLTKRYQAVVLKMEELKQLEDLEFVRYSDIVGLTTSGAAKRRFLLENLNTKIGCTIVKSA